MFCLVRNNNASGGSLIRTERDPWSGRVRPLSWCRMSLLPDEARVPASCSSLLCSCLRTSCRTKKPWLETCRISQKDEEHWVYFCHDIWVNNKYRVVCIWQQCPEKFWLQSDCQCCYYCLLLPLLLLLLLLPLLLGLLLLLLLLLLLITAVTTDITVVTTALPASLTAGINADAMTGPYWPSCRRSPSPVWTVGWSCPPTPSGGDSSPCGGRPPAGPAGHRSHPCWPLSHAAGPHKEETHTHTHITKLISAWLQQEETCFRENELPWSKSQWVISNK